MRRFLIALTLLIGASACQRIEEKFEQTRVEFEVNDVQVAETRAEYDGTTHALKWKAGDVIGCYAIASNNSVFTNTNNEPKKFSGVVFGTPDVMYMYYPYAEGASKSDANVVTSTYPADQDLNAGGFGTNPPMVATAKGLGSPVQFYNTFGVVMFTVKSAVTYERKLNKIEFVANGEEKIAGTYSADMTSEEPVMLMGDAASSMITMTGSVDMKADDECSFLVALPPATYTEGFSITVYDNAGASQTFEVNHGPLALGRSSAVKLDADKEVDGTQSFVFDATPAEVAISEFTISDLSLEFAVDQVKNTVVASRTGFADPTALDITLSYTVTDQTIAPVVTLNALGSFPEQEATPAAGANELALTDVNLTMPRTITVSYGDYYKREYTVKLSQLTDTGLPVVYINTPDAAVIESKDNWLPDDDNKPSEDSGFTYFYIDGSGRKSWDQTVNFEDFAPAKSYVKGRGNTTWGYPKKPYAIKLDKKAKVLGLPKHKRWVLLANTIDKSMIRNKLTFLIAEACYNNGTAGWNPRGHSVELVLNGEHKGNYLLCEQIKIDENRVNVSESDTPQTATSEQGYLLEGDRYWGGDPTETLWWDSYRGQTQYAQQFNADYKHMYGTNYYDDGKWTPQATEGDYRFRWGLKGPDDGDLGLESEGGKETAAYQFINGKVTAAEQFLYGDAEAENYLEDVFKTKTLEEISEYIDVDSFIYYWFVFEIAMNHEPNNPGSVYMHYKDAKAGGYKDGVGRFHMGPVWDFDWGTYSYSFTDSGMYSDKTEHFIIANSLWYHALLKNQEFLDRVSELWTQTKGNLSTLLSDDYLRGMITYLEKSAEYNWGDDHLNWDDIMDECHGDPNQEQNIAFEEAANTVISNFKARVAHLDVLIEDLVNGTLEPETPEEQN